MTNAVCILEVLANEANIYNHMSLISKHNLNYSIKHFGALAQFKFQQLFVDFHTKY